MKITAILSVWNGALWIESALKWLTPYMDCIIVQEANWTSQDPRWAAQTSPDGTAQKIVDFPDPNGKIHFYQLGYWDKGCLAARAELCSHIPKCDWVWVCDVDEFYRRDWLRWLSGNLQDLTTKGYTTISQHSRSFYFDFQRHTVEGFTRLWRYYPGLNPWRAHYPQGKDFSVPNEFNEKEPSPGEAGMEIYHYSYVPVPAVEIKGAESFDVPRERYKDWYRNIYSTFDGENLEELYARNSGGIHVFGGLPLRDYFGDHPEVLRDHPLRHAVWDGSQYLKDGQPIHLKGWWNYADDQ